MNIIKKSIIERPWKVLASFTLVLTAAVLMTGMLRFEQDIFKIIPDTNRTFRILIHSLKASDSHDRLYVLINGPTDPQQLIGAGRRIIQKMRAISVNDETAFKKVTMQKSAAVSMENFEKILKEYMSNPGHFLTDDDIPELTAYLGSLDVMETEFKKSLALLAAPGSSALSMIAVTDPLNLRRFMLAKLSAFHKGLLFAPGPHLLSPDKRTLLVIAEPSTYAKDGSNPSRILGKIAEIDKSLEGAELAVTGGYALEAQQRALLKGDLLSCLLGSALAIGVLFLLIYRNIIVLGFILVPLGVGLQLAMGATAILFDSIHLLAMAFSTVVLGLGIDFAVHIYDRYKMERQAGRSIEEATGLALNRTGRAVLAGGMTTLLAFLVLTVTRNPLLSQIGWLVALGLLFCLLTILWALPSCLVLQDRRRRQDPEEHISRLGMKGLGKVVSGHPLAILILSALIIAAAVPGILKIKFENRLSELQPKDIEAMEAREDLLRAFGTGDTQVLVSWRSKDMAGFRKRSRSLDKALEDLKEKNIIISWSSLGRMTSLRFPDHGHINTAAVEDLFGKYGMELSDFIWTERFIRHMSSGKSGRDFSRQTLETLPSIFKPYFIQGKDDIEGIVWATVPKGGDFLEFKRVLLQSFPDMIVSDPERAVEELVSEVRKDLVKTLSFAGAMIIVVLAFFLRSVSGVILVLIPMLLGLTTTAGLMGWSGVNLNPFNFIILPLLVGIGLDDGIHIYRRYRELGSVTRTLETTGRSVLVTTLTTACGFGSLSLAGYHLLRGMGLMTIFGISACFFFSVITLPAILDTGRRAMERRNNPGAAQPPDGHAGDTRERTA